MKLKIVTWNCNGAFRKKFKELEAFKADVYVIQECENPEESTDAIYKDWADNYLWVGDSKHKGLGVFVNKGIDLKQLDWSDKYEGQRVKHFLPCSINNDFDLLAVWTHQNNAPTFGYIGQLWKYLQVNKSHFKKILLAGDFNSNTIWDVKSRWWNHSDVVRELDELGIKSCYHSTYKEIHGKETKPTFFLQRNLEKPYHIDYIFGSKEFLSKLNKIEVGSVEKWLNISDHLPIFCDFK